MNEPNSLIERILQKVITMFYDSTFLLILLEIQRNKNYVTAESIVNATRLPMKNVLECLSSLKNENILEQFINPESQGKYSKYGYVINYQSAIETIVFKYHTIITKYQNCNVEKINSFICPFDKTKYSYDEALLFFYEGRFECPDCQRELQMETEMKGEGSQKAVGIIQQMNSLKKDLEELKEVYHDIQDYPVMKKPDNLNGMNENKNGGLSRRKRSNENMNDKIFRVYSNAPMPWEEEEMKFEIKENEMEDEEIKVDEIEYTQYVFLQPNKTFDEIVTKIVPRSNHQSPIRSSEIYKPVFMKKGRKMSHRPVSATPQII